MASKVNFFILSAVLPLLLGACESVRGPAAEKQTAAASPPPAAASVVFAQDLRGIDKYRGAIESVLLDGAASGEAVSRQKDYVSAAGQTCSVIQLPEKESSLVACREAKGTWHVRRAYGDMDLSVNLPPDLPVSVASVHTAAPDLRTLIAELKAASVAAVAAESDTKVLAQDAPEIRLETASYAVIGKPAQDEVEVEAAPLISISALPAAAAPPLPVPEARQEDAGAAQNVLWQPRRSARIVLPVAMRPDLEASVAR